MPSKKASTIDSFKEWLLFVLLSVFDWLFVRKEANHSSNQKWLLFVKLDLLGDYVLIRNFLLQLKQNEAYRDHKILFVCNSGILELSKFLDEKIVDHWLPIKLKPFTNDFKYRISILAELKSYSFDLAVFPTQSRSFFYDNMIARLIKSKRKIAPLGNGYNQLPWQKKIGDNWFTEIIGTEFKYDFEYHKNAQFFKVFLSETDSVGYPWISNFSFEKKKRVVVSPGASAEFRRWSTSNFSQVIKGVLERFPDFEIIISGAPNEKEICSEIENNFKNDLRVKNLCGQLKLSELVQELAGATAVITNESGVTHLAKALGVNFLYCISNANHYKRFNPYPEDDSGVKMRYFYPPEFIGELKNNEHKAIEKSYWGSHISIENIKSDAVLSSILDDFTKFYELG